MIFLFMAACTPPTHRTAIELVSQLDNGDLFTMRMVQSDTGMFAGQGTLRTNLWRRNQSAMSLSLRGNEIETTWKEGEHRIGVQEFIHTNDSWNLQIKSTDPNYRS